MDIEEELALHYESTIRAIDTGRVEVAKRRLNAYHRFAESFLGMAAEKGVSFSDESAPSVSLSEWPVPLQIAEYAKNGVLAAISTQNSELVWEGATAPIGFLELSVKYGDFLFFLEMLRLYPRILSLAYESEVERVRRNTIDLSWQPLVQFCRFRLLLLFDRHSRDQAWHYVSRILWTFADLMEVAMDQSDFETFDVLGRELDRLFDDFSLNDSNIHDPGLLSQLVRNERQLIWFELGAWAVRNRVPAEGTQAPRHFGQDALSSSQTDRLLNEIANRFPNLGILSRAYFATIEGHSLETYRRRWLRETVRETLVEIGTIRNVANWWLTWFYCLVGIRLVMAGHSGRPGLHANLRHHIEDLQLALNQILDSPRTWESFLHIGSTAGFPERSLLTLKQAIEHFVDLHRNAISQWDYMRQEVVSQAPLDMSRVEKFRIDCFTAWHEHHWLMRLIQHRGQVRTVRGQPDAEYVEVPFLFPKEAFIADSDEIYFGLGSDAGTDLARKSMDDLLQQLESHCLTSHPTGADEAAARIMSMAVTYEEPAAILIGSVRSEPAFSAHPDFVPSWHDDNFEYPLESYIGRLRNVPLFHFLSTRADKALIVDLPKLGTLRQLRPPRHEYKGLKIQIDEIDVDLAEKLHEEYSSTQPEPFSSLAEAIRWFRLRVLVHVGVKLEWEGTEREAGVALPIRNSTASR